MNLFALAFVVPVLLMVGLDTAVGLSSTRTPTPTPTPTPFLIPLALLGLLLLSGSWLLISRK